MKDSKSKSNSQLDIEPFDKKPLGRNNFIAIGVAGAMIVVGFLLMLGSGTTAENGFNPDIFSTRRIVIAPLLAFLGFVAMAVAICIVPRDSKKQ